MTYLLRHLASFLALPFAAAVAIPLWIGRPPGSSFFAPRFPGVLVFATGLALGAIGLALFLSSVVHFFRYGRGTLAPWDPPRELVVTGPYQFVRNPMILGVAFILFAEAFTLDSKGLLVWALSFIAINLVYIPLLEEPRLAERFGAAYSEYCGHVGRFIPRLRPWRRSGNRHAA